ncbi:uncharacterized protein [Leptinotarsa decemlineata]|uniref:uncharacterized protein n=1 Tax=Leptinotarsa decemlineata TaxID=7539 RepID=UPI003D30B15E
MICTFSDMKIPYIVWNAERIQKTIILVDDDCEAPYNTLILNASIKLDLNGSVLVLESNGTPVEDEVLPYFKNEVLMLLQPGEYWQPPKSDSSLTSGLSLSSTLPPRNDLLNSSTNSTITIDSIDQEIPMMVSSENIIISESTDCNAETWWKNFKIPWEKLNSNQIQNLENKIRDAGTITRLTQIIVDDMRCFKKVIPIRAFKIIAKKVINSYPSVFIDIDRDGVILGDGSHKLVQKLIDRNNYLNRPLYKRALDSNTNNTANPVANKKMFLSARAGCSNWDPEIVSSQMVSDKEKKATDINEDFYTILEKSYPEIRKYLNNVISPTISTIKEEWPIILSPKSIIWHFNKLTGSNINLLDKINEDVEIIKSLWFKKTHNTSSASVEKEVVADDSIKCLTYIAQYFGESIEDFFLVSKTMSDIHNDDLPLTPSIVAVGDAQENEIFFVFVERENIDLQGYGTFMEALKVAFSLYFILNLKYPPKLQATFELLQRMYLKIHPDAGSKSRGKVTQTKKKVLNYMLKFNNHSLQIK